MAGEETVRTFPAQKCRFTLPGMGWTWIDKQAPNTLFMAENTKGFIITLSTVNAPTPERVDEQFAKGFEKTFYQPGQLEKRSGRFVTFRGLPSYQAEGTLTDGRTTASRVFTAHNFVYTLSLIGTKEPVEDDPEFEKLMQGFEFTASPEQQVSAQSGGQTQPAPDSDYARALNISERMGRLAGACILGALLLLLFRWMFRKRKTDKT
jgi:hypothetical protein